MRIFWTALFLVCAVCVTVQPAICGDEEYLPGQLRTELDRYVATPDPNYKYELLKEIKGEGFTAYLLNMISQKWRSEDEVDRVLWQHWVTILKPDDLASDTALLFIGGGSNGKEPPNKVDDMLVKIAMGTKSVVVALGMIPNEPLHFKDEFMDKYKEKGRTEDELISFTWDKYLKTGDPTWPARLPMTKAVVRAMDTVTLFLESEQGGGVTVDKFTIAGGSKRGWTTWTTGAVDPRVVAIAPIVIDMLNVVPSFEHHWRAYGFWSPAVGNYVEMGLMDKMDDPDYQKLLKIVEPYSYRSRYTMPKFVINSCGDQFFLPDSWQFYWDQLPAKKLIRYVPNTDHGLDGSDAAESLGAYHYAIINDLPLPNYDWKVEDDGTIRVTAEDKPAEVKLWQATNPEARDFRLMKIGKAWTSTPLEPNADGEYVAKVDAPEKGWTAYMVELTYPSPAGVNLKVTSGVTVTPKDLPFKYPPETVSE
ncbi:MAG: PhoPQ-activated pathogenicity [Candidatus Omnitrophica bacterium]|nr:PhoPQ-activated pathogenicity [Candidatus Omnitrophota bacterium]